MLWIALLAVLGTSSLLATSEGSASSPLYARFDCTAAGDYRWIALSSRGELLYLRADSTWTLMEGWTKLLEPTQADELDRLFDAAREIAPSPTLRKHSDPSLEIEPRRFSVWASRGRGASWITYWEDEQSKAQSQLSIAIAAHMSRQARLETHAGYLLALPLDQLPCLGVDTDRWEPPGTDTRDEASLLDRALRIEAVAIELDASQVARLDQAVFRGKGQVRYSTTGGEQILVLFRNGTVTR